jgi:Protein of unknown function (DUF3237)
MGIRHAPPEVMQRLNAGQIVDPKLVYFRTVPKFETAAPALQWLARSVFVGVGDRSPNEVIVRFYRLEYGEKSEGRTVSPQTFGRGINPRPSRFRTASASRARARWTDGRRALPTTFAQTGWEKGNQPNASQPQAPHQRRAPPYRQVQSRRHR